MKFLVDSMLGKLARFLRIFGYDTVYANDLVGYFNLNPVPDDKLRLYAKKNNRHIITKDELLYKGYIEKSFYLKGEGIYNYLNQLKKTLKVNFEFKIAEARCSICNSRLKKIKNKSVIKDFVLKESFNNYNEFFECVNLHCNKIYWEGSHITDIKNRLENDSAVL
ncbi:hypothetical protein LCGC14_0575130 [marine sediment metagenome]|uniref:Mut7-C RNAse domain-containing protein n=1 Tax=marine sediment metagenome TaxID=412755 RepID=A0A0F9RI36_9ZZZZ|nr:MAG: hypothetical protein Lokiarch_00980 [Candidatus Lokiarchaeum sp. GC14_75]